MEPFLDKFPLPLPLLPDTCIYRKSGPFDGNTGLFCENIGLFCQNAWVFFRGSALLRKIQRFFYGSVALAASQIDFSCGSKLQPYEMAVIYIWLQLPLVIKKLLQLCYKKAVAAIYRVSCPCYHGSLVDLYYVESVAVAVIFRGNCSCIVCLHPTLQHILQRALILESRYIMTFIHHL